MSEKRKFKCYKRFYGAPGELVSNGHASFSKGEKEGEMIVVSQKGNNKPTVETVELFKDKMIEPLENSIIDEVTTIFDPHGGFITKKTTKII